MRVRQDQRMVIGKGAHPSPQPNVTRAPGGRGDEHLGRRDDLESRRMVFADPRLVVSEYIQQLDQLEVAL